MSTSPGVFSPDSATGHTVTLRKQTSAIEIISQEDGLFRLGFCQQLSPGARLEVRGEGFTSNTLRVQANGLDYVVLKNSVLERG